MMIKILKYLVTFGNKIPQLFLNFFKKIINLKTVCYPPSSFLIGGNIR